MLKRHKDLLRAIVASLRLTLAGAPAADGPGQRGDLDRELERLGVAPDGTLTLLDALPSVSAQERRARAAAEEYLAAAVAKAGARKAGDSAAAEARRLARDELVERAAYSWINRLLALRAMEARGLIDETLRTNPDYDGLSEALYVLRQSEPARADGADGGWWAVIEDACKAQAASLPGLFDLADPAVALRPSTPALIRCVQIIGTAPAGFTLDETDAAFADPDAVGWAYQFYQEAAKARVYAKLGTGGKATTRAEIAAATQLFTEPYMVQWLLQNSLGRSYHEAYPDSKLPATWAYYIRNRPEGQTAPEHPRPLEALNLIDPCCGTPRGAARARPNGGLPLVGTTGDLPPVEADPAGGGTRATARPKPGKHAARGGTPRRPQGRKPEPRYGYTRKRCQTRPEGQHPDNPWRWGEPLCRAIRRIGMPEKPHLCAANRQWPGEEWASGRWRRVRAHARGRTGAAYVSVEKHAA